MTWQQALSGIPIATYPGAFLWAAASGIFSPCMWAMFPIVLSYVAHETAKGESPKSQGFVLSASFVAGMTLVYTAMGVAVSLVGGNLPVSQSYISLFAGIMLVLIGLNFLGVYQIRLPAFMNAAPKPTRRKGVVGAFILGMFGAVFMGNCGIGFLMPVLTVVLEKGNVLYGATMLFIFGIGHGLPLLFLGTLAGFANAWLKKAQAAKKYVDIASGIILIAVGIYYLTQI
ncbi:MAG: cytochrome c biogenesis protein CcdA [Actinomycetota bacterium]